MADLKITNFRAGDTFKLAFDLDAYPAADGWALTYYLKGENSYSINASIVDGQYEVLESAANTANWVAGVYGAFFQVSKDDEKYTLELGQTTILAAMSALANYDPRSHVKKVLDALEALILGKASKDVDSYSIAGRQLTKMKPEEILKWKSHYAELYRRELGAERVAQGKKPGNTVVVRF